MRPLKYVLALLPFLLLSATVTKDSAQIAKDNEAFRTKINGEYADAATSPLTEEDLASFKGLPFFPIDTSFYVVADFERTRRAKAFEMQTTTDRVSVYPNTVLPPSGSKARNTNCTSTKVNALRKCLSTKTTFSYPSRMRAMAPAPMGADALLT